VGRELLGELRPTGAPVLGVRRNVGRDTWFHKPGARGCA
jgi:hypothetical protein